MPRPSPIPTGEAPRILVVTPVRDEREHLGATIESMLAQTLRPAAWMIVDDGSSDGTGELVERTAAEHPWIQGLRRPDRGDRRVGGGVIEAFDAGLACFDLDEFDFVCKLDGDLRFGERYFEVLMEKFAADPLLGSASGKCWDRTASGWELLRTNDEFSLGAAKCYSVECFRAIGGFVAEVMWDGIDCHRCLMVGRHSRSFHDEALRLYELRPMGSSHGSVFHGRFRWGRGQHFIGTHPLYALGIALYRTFERPWLLGGLCILAGYLWSALRRTPRYADPEFRRHLRHWQLDRLRLS
ncbi:MAG: glycosyltransferase [Planctomycetota bacterium]|jgi:glycosyltransferase involved in cell wall biosynthesis|nr:glycosyltransferase [Planctomycetota bacterium]MDP6762825.1 glycosyltransferase [Planctomycetota bacterium]MDP6990499.1 glycosyltransferase [Planctomycetota bacterium]